MADALVRQVFEDICDFDLDHIFDCGQCFRWAKQEDGSYSGIVEGAFANIAYYPGGVKLTPIGGEPQAGGAADEPAPDAEPREAGNRGDCTDPGSADRYASDSPYNTVAHGTPAAQQIPGTQARHVFEEVYDDSAATSHEYPADRADDFFDDVDEAFYIREENRVRGGTVIVWSNHLANLPIMREKFWRNYLDLDRDYGAIKRILTTEDDVMRRAVRIGGGIRILNQNKWETLISFIISQNNNIPRIKNCIEKLCALYGDKIGTLKGRPVFAFPTMERMATLKESDLEACRLGYRARYIVEAARQVSYDGGAFLETGDRMPTGKIEEYLLSLSGVGPKVANCVMLFAMKQTGIFPIDVWVRRVMSRFYGMGEDNVSAMKEYAERNFGEYGGIAQQYLFYYIRNLARGNRTLYDKLEMGPEAEPLYFNNLD